MNRTLNIVGAFLFGFAILFVIQINHAFARGSTPRLNLITPRGVERGADHILRFSGQRLSETQQVFLYSTGIEVLEFKQIDDQNVDVSIRVLKDCRIGEHIVQIRTSRGISDFRSFFVGALPHVSEAEPNNELGTSQQIQLNHSVLGVVESEDVDLYQIACKKGERLNVEIEAIRLGFMFDPFIAVLNEQNFELAVSDDSCFAAQDGAISLTIPEDGIYHVLVREASYGGNGNCRYRLNIGNFPRPQVAFPAGGKPEQLLDVQFLGDAGGTISQSIQVPKQPGFRSGLTVVDDFGCTPSPVAFRISNLENVIEKEPNNLRSKQATSHLVPCAFNGVISDEGDHDYFRFSAKKGESYDIECFARRIGSGLDPVINVFNQKGKHFVGDDDARRPDCFLKFGVPEDGDYFVRVRDHLDRGAPNFAYRVEVNKAQPKLSLTIPRVDRYSQLRQKICVPQGNRFATMISANRQNFGGELELGDIQWPAGVKVDTKPMAANLNLMPVVFTATQDAEISGTLIDLTARHIDTSKNIVGDFSIVSDFVLGNPNNSVYYTASVDQLACAVTKKVPFKIDIVQPTVPIVRNGSMNLKIVVTRDQGFDQSINVQFPFRPPGLGTRPQIQIKKGKNEAYYPLNANGSAQLGKWPIYAIAQADIEGPVWVSSQLAELQITEPIVVVEMNRTALEKGKTASVFCKLTHREKFEGEATAELLGLPPNIEIPKLKFTSDSTELNFTVSTNDKSPVGKHKGLFCRITINRDGEQIVSTAGRSELQINPPPAKPVLGNAVTKKAAKLPQSKPKSRLQQLREQRRKASSGH